jgi:hypothetical protein
VPSAAKRTLRVTALAGTLAVVFLLLVPTWVSAAPATAPYPGATATGWYTTASAGCASSAQLVASNWSAKTGLGVLGEQVSASNCGDRFTGSSMTSYGELTTGWDVVVPVTIPSNASGQYVNATWNFSWSETDQFQVAHLCRGNLTSGAQYGYLDCSVDASAEMYLLSYLVDTTTSTWYAAGPYGFGSYYPSVYNFTYRDRDTVCAPSCATSNLSYRHGGTHNGSLSFTFSFYLASPNASDHWEIVAYSESQAYAAVTTAESNFSNVRPMVASAHATFDMGTGGRSGVLTGIAIT